MYMFGGLFPALATRIRVIANKIRNQCTESFLEQSIYLEQDVKSWKEGYLD
jgi:hypothetical protein